MKAILSDIHANLEALEAVLEDIQGLEISSIYCLGDIIGYGPDPLPCIDRAMQFQVCVLGNHDQAAIFDSEGFNANAEKAIFWTRQQLESQQADMQQHRSRWDFICGLPRSWSENGLHFVHGSLRNPLNDYIFPEDIYNVRKLERVFAMIQRHAFQGHTHVPGIFVDGPKFLPAQEVGTGYRLSDEKTMINVGSVGQPRDGDPRACYVILDEDLVNFRRVSYPVEKTIEKIYSVPELDNFLGDRLRDGR